MSKRRGFLKGLGLLGLVGVGAAEAKSSIVPVVINNTPKVEEIDPQILKELENGLNTLTLQESYDPVPQVNNSDTNNVFSTGFREVMRLDSSGNLGLSTNVSAWDNIASPQSKYHTFSFAPSYKKQVSVALKPGPDGNLYVKENDKWRKV